MNSEPDCIVKNSFTRFCHKSVEISGEKKQRQPSYLELFHHFMSMHKVALYKVEGQNSKRPEMFQSVTTLERERPKLLRKKNLAG